LYAPCHCFCKIRRNEKVGAFPASDNGTSSLAVLVYRKKKNAENPTGVFVPLVDLTVVLPVAKIEFVEEPEIVVLSELFGHSFFLKNLSVFIKFRS
jgi:hypothetical protein